MKQSLKHISVSALLLAALTGTAFLYGPEDVPSETKIQVESWCEGVVVNTTCTNNG